MEDIMIKIQGVTMDYHQEKNRTNSLKEFLINLLRGRIHYDFFRAVDNLNLEIRRGEVVGIVGRNGAGKSTLLKMIAGVLSPTKGSIIVNGSIAPMLELGAGFDFDLTARDNIFINGAILGYGKKFLKERFDNIVEFSELGEFIDQPVRTFSSGMVTRLAFAIATQVNPDILIVDEILSVGDSRFRQKSEARMMELMGGGTTVLMVSHSLPQIRALCDRVVWLDHGKLVMQGDTKTVCDAYEGLIDFDNAPQLEIGTCMNDIQRVNMYADNWLPPKGSYKIKTGSLGIVYGKLRFPFADLKGTEKIKVSLDCNEDADPVTIDLHGEHCGFEIKGKPNTIVTVTLESNFFRKTGVDTRQLTVVLEDTVGK